MYVDKKQPVRCRVAAAAEQCTAAAWDGCHKIYLVGDETEFEKMVGYGYGVEWALLPPAEALNDPSGLSRLVRADCFEGDRSDQIRQMVEMLSKWWDASCSLRFVTLVESTDRKDTVSDHLGREVNDGTLYTDVVPQGDGDLPW